MFCPEVFCEAASGVLYTPGESWTDSDGCNMCRALQRPFNSSAALSGKITPAFAAA